MDATGFTTRLPAGRAGRRSQHARIVQIEATVRTRRQASRVSGLASLASVLLADLSQQARATGSPTAARQVAEVEYRWARSATDLQGWLDSLTVNWSGMFWFVPRHSGPVGQVRESADTARPAGNGQAAALIRLWTTVAREVDVLAGMLTRLDSGAPRRLRHAAPAAATLLPGLQVEWWALAGQITGLFPGPLAHPFTGPAASTDSEDQPKAA